MKQRFFKIIEQEGRPAYQVTFINAAGVITVLRFCFFEEAENAMKDLKTKGHQPGLTINYSNIVRVNLNLKKT